jgi:hypothetical protein
MEIPYFVHPEQISTTPGCDRLLNSVGVYELDVSGETLRTLVGSFGMTSEQQAGMLAAIESQTSITNLAVSDDSC